MQTGTLISCSIRSFSSANGCYGSVRTELNQKMDPAIPDVLASTYPHVS